MTVTVEGLPWINVQPALQAVGHAIVTMGQHGYPAKISHTISPAECRQLAAQLDQIADLADPRPVEEPDDEQGDGEELFEEPEIAPVDDDHEN